jgi:hypothetical protein
MPIASTSITGKLVFAQGFSEQIIFEAQSRGYLSHVMAELDGNRFFAIFFYDPIRLQQDLHESAKHDRPFIADPGMIVLPELTLDAMQSAVQRLCQEGYFDHLVELSAEQLERTNSLHWPPI